MSTSPGTLDKKYLSVKEAIYIIAIVFAGYQFMDSIKMEIHDLKNSLKIYDYRVTALERTAGIPAPASATTYHPQPVGVLPDEIKNPKND
jgi:hypothetical protein